MQLLKRFLPLGSGSIILLALLAAGIVIWAGYIALRSTWAHNALKIAVVHAGQRIAQADHADSPACITCHGESGEGNRALGAPRIAGLPAAYIEKQLHDFARNPLQTGVILDPIARDYSKTPRVQVDLTVYTPGVRRHAAMYAAAAALDDGERHAVAQYFSSLPYHAVALPSDPETLERGEDLALRGKPEYGVPACTSCHGPAGRGLGKDFPPLVGLTPEYIIQQLNNWQTGARDNDTMALMRNVSDQLTDGDKVNVAAYFANVSGQTHGPEN